EDGAGTAQEGGNARTGPSPHATLLNSPLPPQCTGEQPGRKGFSTIFLVIFLAGRIVEKPRILSDSVHSGEAGPAEALSPAHPMPARSVRHAPTDLSPRSPDARSHPHALRGGGRQRAALAPARPGQQHRAPPPARHASGRPPEAS